MKKVLYFNMPNGIDYEKELLKKWQITDLILEEKDGKFSTDVLKGYDGLVCEYIKIGEEIFKNAPDLKIIGQQCIGVDDIDIDTAEKYNIAVTNAPGFCSEDVATHAMALLLSVIRQTAMFDHDVKKGIWDCYSGLKMNRLSGKKAGLVSFGSIPQKLVPMLKGFGIEVFAYDIFKDNEFMSNFSVTKVDSLTDMLSFCDYIFLHTPLIPETFHIINKETIIAMKDNAILINVSRGALVDEVALIDALKSGKLLGAGLDVLEDEQHITTELLNMNNVTITPHVAFLSEDSLRQSREIALEQLIQRLCHNEVPTNCVNKIKI